MEIEGTITALVTPFLNQRLDKEGLIFNIRRQIAAQVDGIIVLGTTGEACTLNQDEKKEVISIAIEEANGRVPILVGTGSYSTEQTINNTLLAKELGADGALVVTPYYNKPTQKGIYQHFKAITEAVDLPLMLYNIPGRCSANIEIETLLKIAALKNILGIKEASGSIQQAGDVLHIVSREYPHFKVFSGDDVLTFPMMALGAVGVVSVVSNLVPAQIVALTKAALKKDFIKARDLHFELLLLFKIAFIETNPIPIKAAMTLCGLPAGECRLPLYEMEEKNFLKLRQQLSQLNLINHS